MKLSAIKLLVASLLMFVASPAFATTIHETFDTSSLYGTSGYLYLQYVPVNAVSSSSVSASSFTDGMYGAETSLGVVNGSAVSGALPGVVTFSNSNGINDYNQAFTFGKYLGFDLNFTQASGAALDASNTFSVSLFGDAAGNTPLLTPDGIVLTETLNFDGSVTSHNAAPVPEPSTLLLLSAGLFGVIVLRKRKQEVAAYRVADSALAA